MICKIDPNSRKVTGIFLKFWKPYGAAGPTPMYPVLPWEIPHVKSTAMLGIWNLKLFILHWRLVESFYCVSISRQDIKTHLAKDQRSRYLDAKDFLVIPKQIFWRIEVEIGRISWKIAIMTAWSHFMSLTRPLSI